MLRSVKELKQKLSAQRDTKQLPELSIDNDAVGDLLNEIKKSNRN